MAVNKEEALQKEQDVKADIEKIKAGHDSILTSSKQTSDLCTAFIDILQPLCAKGISRAHLRLPHKHPAKPIVKPSDSSHKPKNIPKSKTKAPSKQKLKDKPPKLQASPIKSNTTNGSPEVVTLSDDEPPQLNNESSRYASQMPSTSTKHGIKRPVSDTNYENEVAGYCPPPPISKKPRKRAKTPGDDVPKICFTCKKVTFSILQIIAQKICFYFRKMFNRCLFVFFANIIFIFNAWILHSLKCQGPDVVMLGLAPTAMKLKEKNLLKFFNRHYIFSLIVYPTSIILNVLAFFRGLIFFR